jgi:geranylgeranyl pyrophosphate synthase
LCSNVLAIDDPNTSRKAFPDKYIPKEPKSLVDPFAMVADDISNLNSSIKGLLGSDNSKLETVARYFFEHEGGKKIRPSMVLLMSLATNAHLEDNGFSVSGDLGKSSCGVLDSQLRLAEIAEMIHTASLLHDDGKNNFYGAYLLSAFLVIDHADSRRGVGSVNQVFGNKLAILAVR